MASTLKLKPILSLQDNGSKIDKFGIARTDRKVWETVINALDKEGVSSEKHRLYVIQFTNLEGAEKVKALLEEHYPGIEVIINDIPAVLACHAGLGVLAVQSVLK